MRMMTDELYTTAQAAALTGKAERSVRQLAERHADIGRRIGHWWMFSAADLERIRAIGRGGWRGGKRASSEAAQ